VNIWMRKVWLDDEKTVLILTEKLNMLLKVIIQLPMIMKRPSGQMMMMMIMMMEMIMMMMIMMMMIMMINIMMMLMF
jgi:hypothetical protein